MKKLELHITARCGSLPKDGYWHMEMRVPSSIRQAVRVWRLRKRIGKSVVCGHTHKAGQQHSHQGYGGRITQPLQAMEVGHLMDMAKAKYLPAGHGNWQQAFGILHIDKNTVHPQLVQIQNKSFVVEGQHYSW